MRTHYLIIIFSFFILASCSENEVYNQETTSYQGISTVEDFWITVRSDDFNVNLSKEALQEISTTLIFNESDQLRGFTSEKANEELDEHALSEFVGILLNTSNTVSTSYDKKTLKRGCEVIRGMTPTLCWEQNNQIGFINNCCRGSSASSFCVIPCFD